MIREFEFDKVIILQSQSTKKCNVFHISEIERYNINYSCSAQIWKNRYVAIQPNKAEFDKKIDEIRKNFVDIDDYYKEDERIAVYKNE